MPATGSVTPQPPGRPAAVSRRGRASTAGWFPYLMILAGLAAVLCWLWTGGTHAARGGTLALAGVMFAAALARLALPESRAGLLASRKRLTDVVTLAALATGLLAAGLLLPVPL
jgi:Protein of unknown function (DUF3017)